jgi:hypothetical protein
MNKLTILQKNEVMSQMEKEMAQLTLGDTSGYSSAQVGAELDAKLSTLKDVFHKVEIAAAAAHDGGKLILARLEGLEQQQRVFVDESAALVQRMARQEGDCFAIKQDVEKVWGAVAEHARRLARVQGTVDAVEHHVLEELNKRLPLPIKLLPPSKTPTKNVAEMQYGCALGTAWDGKRALCLLPGHRAITVTVKTLRTWVRIAAKVAVIAIGIVFNPGAALGAISELSDALIEAVKIARAAPKSILADVCDAFGPLASEVAAAVEKAVDDTGIEAAVEQLVAASAACDAENDENMRKKAIVTRDGLAGVAEVTAEKLDEFKEKREEIEELQDALGFDVPENPGEGSDNVDPEMTRMITQSLSAAQFFRMGCVVSVRAGSGKVVHRWVCNRCSGRCGPRATAPLRSDKPIVLFAGVLKKGKGGGILAKPTTRFFMLTTDKILAWFPVDARGCITGSEIARVKLDDDFVLHDSDAAKLVFQARRIKGSKEKIKVYSLTQIEHTAGVINRSEKLIASDGRIFARGIQPTPAEWRLELEACLAK